MALIDDFKANLIGGGARANQFRVTITPPSGIAIGLDVRRASFLVRASNLPAQTLGEIAIPFRGRQIYIAGDRSFEDAWTAWRTAFRESYKLAHSDNATDKYRLKLWCSSDRTEFGKYSKDGANQGKEYYTNNPNDARINDWAFVKTMFKEKWEQ